jgi:hypothetical protein
MSDKIIEKIEQIDCTRTFVLKIKLSDKYLHTLKTYAAKTLKEPHLREDHRDQLAGHIKKGRQLKLPPDAPELHELAAILSSMSTQYYNTYISYVKGKDLSESDPSALVGVHVETLWLNSYFAGDYNPPHKHGTISPLGLSSFLYINTPNCIKNKLPSAGTNFTGNDLVDGMTMLYWGYNFGSNDVTDGLEYPQSSWIYPEEGVLYLFPRWMDHLVAPFQGTGIRITMGANVSLWTNKYWDIYKHIYSMQKIS